MAGNVPRGDVLVHHRHHRRDRANHRRETRRPLAGGIDDNPGLHRALVCLDVGDRARVVAADAGDAAVRLDGDAEFTSALGKLERDAVGIQPAIVGNVHRALDAPGRKKRRDIERLTGSDGADIEPQPARPTDLPLQRLEPVRAGGQAQAADLVPADVVGALIPELVVKLDTVVHQPHQCGRGAELADQADGVERGSAGQFPFLNDQHVCPAALGQVPRDAAAGDAAADDNDFRLFFHWRRTLAKRHVGDNSYFW